MNRFYALAAASLLAVCTLTTSCSTYQARFSPPVRQDSTVVLRENDFRYIQQDLRGDYEYWGIFLGFLFPCRIGVDIPFGDPRRFSNALADMYSGAQAEAEGGSTQLVNWKYDDDLFFIPLYVINPYRQRAVFRADLIEYTKP
jgi:hypothetical protein